MFLRKKKNKSGSVSVQIISKTGGKYKVVKTIGFGKSKNEIDNLLNLGRQEIDKLLKQPKLFISQKDTFIEEAFSMLNNSSIRTVGPELIFGKIYDYIGFDNIEEKLFRYLVIARLAFPLSKLKTTEYLYRYQGIDVHHDRIYRFLDKLNNKLKTQVEQISFEHTKKVLKGKISVVFYDMTTLYFEASDEDDLRKTGFSKDGKHSNTQIFIGLLVGLGGYAIGYDIFEGNTYEGHTLIPFVEKISKKFNLQKPVVVADSGLLSNDNIKALQEEGYEYILGARIKNETKIIKEKILKTKLKNAQTKTIEKDENTRIIISYSDKRARKDAHNRERGLKRLEKRIKSGKLTKSNINNRGYNKYLKLEGEVSIEIDYDKYNEDNKWDGLKGYITNSRLSDDEIIENYGNLWHIEKRLECLKPIYVFAQYTTD